MTVRLPMRFTDAPLDQAKSLIRDGNYVMEQKMDGTRALFVVTPEGLTVYGGGGTVLAHTAATQHLPQIEPALMAVVKQLRGTDTEIVLDGELMTERGEVWLFDMPSSKIHGIDLITPLHELWKRRACLEGLFATGIFEGTKVHLLAQAETEAQKNSMWSEVCRAGAEGVMVKHVDSRYHPGQRVTHSQKLKLVKTADVVVMSRHVDGHQNMTFGAYDESGQLRKIGGCSTIGKPLAYVGEVIEIRYLYFTGASVYQPRMVRVRQDKAAEDCMLTQFPEYSREAVSC